MDPRTSITVHVGGILISRGYEVQGHIHECVATNTNPAAVYFNIRESKLNELWQWLATDPDGQAAAKLMEDFNRQIAAKLVAWGAKRAQGQATPAVQPLAQ